MRCEPLAQMTHPILKLSALPIFLIFRFCGKKKDILAPLGGVGLALADTRLCRLWYLLHAPSFPRLDHATVTHLFTFLPLSPSAQCNQIANANRSLNIHWRGVLRSMVVRQVRHVLDNLRLHAMHLPLCDIGDILGMGT